MSSKKNTTHHHVKDLAKNPERLILTLLMNGKLQREKLTKAISFYKVGVRTTHCILISLLIKKLVVEIADSR